MIDYNIVAIIISLQIAQAITFWLILEQSKKPKNKTNEIPIIQYKVREIK